MVHYSDMTKQHDPYVLHETAGAATYLTLPAFDAMVGSGVRLAISTRQGGVSEGPYSTLNLGLSTADSAENVLENRRRLGVATGISLDDTVGMNQVHGTHVAVVNSRERGYGALEGTTALADTDGMVTTTTGIALRALAADCVPVALYDRRRGAIAAIHAGWRGILAGVVPATIAMLTSYAGTEPTDLVAALGPCIGACHYEVGPEVAGPFAAAFDGTDDREAGAEQVVWQRDGRSYLDLTAALGVQLRRHGVLADQVVTSTLCTACRRDLFYSHRAEGPTGRFGMLVWLTGGASVVKL